MRMLPANVRGSRVAAVLAAGLSIAVPLAVLLVQQLTQLGVRGTPCCDYAVMELDTRAFLRGEQLVGLYSREGWRHPGPAPFLWDSLFRALPGHSFAEHQVAAVGLAIAAVVAVALLVRRRLTPVAFVAALAVVAVWLARFDIAVWQQPWTPITAMSWVLVAVTAAAAYAAGASRRALLVFAVAGSMAVQSHVGTSPTVVVALVAVVVAARRRRRATAGDEVVGRERPSWWWVGGVTAALWTLPLVDLVFGDHWLARTLKGLLFGDRPVPMRRRSILVALVHILGLSPSAQSHEFGGESPYVAGARLTPLTIGLALVGVALAAYTVVARRRHPFPFLLVLVAGGGLLLTVVTMTRANGPFYRYLLFPSLGLGALIWVGGVTAVVGDLVARRDSAAVAVHWGGVAVAVLAGVVALPSAQPAVAVRFGTPLIEALDAGVAAHCADLPRRTVMDTNEEWVTSLAVAVAIDRCTDVRIVGNAGFIAGPSYEAGDATPNVFVGVPSAGTPPGRDLVVAGGHVVRVLATKG